jgi:exodeoxyribonuclease VII large subunit
VPLALVLGLAMAASDARADVPEVDQSVPVDEELGIRLPEGFQATVVHEGVGRVRHIAVTDEGTIYARLRHPGERLQQQAQKLDGLELRLKRAMQQQLRDARSRLDTLTLRQRPLQPGQRLTQLRQILNQLSHQMHQLTGARLQQHKQRLAEAARLLNTVSPLNTLERGYSITRSESGALIRAASQVQEGEKVKTRLASGELLCRVERVLPE